ncbi:MAG: elongation factor P [Mariprofundales bacterium]
MQINATTIRAGNILHVNKGLWRVMKTHHVTPGKGVACMQVEMRNLETGSKTNKRFNSTERVDRVTLSQKNMQFLYSDSESWHFMDLESYDQIALLEPMVENVIAYLLPEQVLIIEFFDNKPLNVQLPKVVELVVETCDAAIKGQTATGSYKPGILETGSAILVPPYLEAGTKIKVNTEDGSYIERA